MQRRPQLVVVAGPNGVGKSTYSRIAFATGFLLLVAQNDGVSVLVVPDVPAWATNAVAFLQTRRE